VSSGRLWSALDAKVLRDALGMRAQLIAIALVIACGVGLFLGMGATMRSLESARSSYYARQRFAHVFARLERAPEVLAERLAEIPGVARLQTRIVADVTLDVPGMQETATGRLISLPDHGEILVNGLQLRSGRLPSLDRTDEVVASEGFAEAHDLELGDRIRAVINGRREALRVVGTGLSPEFTYTVGPGQLIPDDQRFGVLWMRRTALAAAFDLEGAFNDVVLQTSHGASVDRVIARVDRVLDRYGGTGAIERSQQTSAFFIENELNQLATFGLMVPLTFLFVAALLLNVVIGRIVASQRAQIAALKALGYHNREIGLHYAKLVAIVVGLGSLLGILTAAWLGTAMTRLYADYYRFPELPFVMQLRDVALAVGISVFAALLGAANAIYRSVRVPPAEGMRPAAPATYRPTLLERLGWSAWVSPSARMVLREFERRPVRAGLSVVGIAFATALIVLSTFSFDAMRFMMNVQFGLSQREDVQVTLFGPRAVSTLQELEHLPGVMHAEPFRNVPVRLRFGHRERTLGITGVPADATLQQVLDADLRAIQLPPEGLVLSSKLAKILGARAGDVVELDLLEGSRRTTRAVVARVAETFVGLQAFMELDALCRLLGETRSLSGAWLLVDERRLDALYRSVLDTPLIASVTTRHQALASFQKIMDESLGTSLSFSVGFSLVMALGVLYNAARITLAERARDLASLRVLGFRRSEVTRMLLGEIATLTLVGVPIGLGLGYALAALLVSSPGFDSEQFRLPFVIARSTYGLAALTIVAATAIAGFAAWRRLERIDIVDVLKTGD